jgi:hypothetical protein
LFKKLRACFEERLAIGVSPRRPAKVQGNLLLQALFLKKDDRTAFGVARNLSKMLGKSG